MTSIRLLPGKTPRPLSIGDARDAAKAAYTQARQAQRELVTHLDLLALMYRPGSVSYVRLRGERAEARRQVERAQAVLDALGDAIEAMERAEGGA